MKLQNIDLEIINFMKKYYLPISRFALFVVFFWFGALKVLGFSPASGLVKDLLVHTIPFMTPDYFVVFFGFFEMLIGILFLIKGMERWVIPLLFIHMITTFLPLILLRDTTWTKFLVPTIEGQYILKNLVIIATAIGIASHLHPMKRLN